MKKFLLNMTAIMCALSMIYGFTLMSQAAGTLEVRLDNTNYAYNGKRPEVTSVMKGGMYLSDKDYEVYYGGSSEAVGTRKVRVESKNGEYGEVQYTITPANIASACKASLSQTSFAYTGTAVYPAETLVFKANGATLRKNVDYSVTYYNNVNPGTATVSITGKGNFGGTLNMNFSIAKGVQNLQVKAAPAKVKVKKKTTIIVTGNKGAVTFKSLRPSLATVNSKGVVKAKKKTGTALIRVTAAATAGYDQTSVRLEIPVTGKELTKKNTKLRLSDTSFVYDGDPHKPTVKVKYRGKTLKKKRDYKVTYRDNVEIGRASVTVTGVNKYSGSVTSYFYITDEPESIDDEDYDVTLSDDWFVYDGDYQRPTVTIKYNGKKLKKDRDYTVTYYDNKNAGNAKILIKGKGDYTGRRTETFTISKAPQSNFTARLTSSTISVGGTTRIMASGARGNVSFSSNSPTYAKHMGSGIFKGLKSTKNYVTVTAKASGDENYKSKTVTLKLRIN